MRESKTSGGGGLLKPLPDRIGLRMHLNSSGIGGYLRTAFINHLCYADDLCLISLSSSGMQQLLHICNEYAAEHQLICNGSKSFSLCFKRKYLKISPLTYFLDQSKILLIEQWNNYFNKEQ